MLFFCFAYFCALHVCRLRVFLCFARMFVTRILVTRFWLRVGGFTFVGFTLWFLRWEIVYETLTKSSRLSRVRTYAPKHFIHRLRTSYHDAHSTSKTQFGIVSISMY